LTIVKDYDIMIKTLERGLLQGDRETIEFVIRKVGEVKIVSLSDEDVSLLKKLREKFPTNP